MKVKFTFDRVPVFTVIEQTAIGLVRTSTSVSIFSVGIRLFDLEQPLFDHLTHLFPIS